MPVTPVATPTCPPAGATITPTYTPTSTQTPTATLPPGWYEVGDGSATNGGISNNSGFSDRPSLAVGANGTPYIAWYDDSSGNSEIYVRRWNGNSWEEVGAGSATGGGISNNSGNSLYPSVAINSDNTPYVAWFDNDAGDNEIYVRHWNGSSWEEVGAGSASGGGISNNSGNSYDPSMAITAGGTPYVAWEDHSGGDSEIYVRRWNGSNWEEVGGGSATGGGISNNNGTSFYSSVAIAPDDTPYVAWQDDSGGNLEIYARHWNGSSWEEVGTGSASGGGISNNAGDSRIPSASISPGGIPYISWHDNTSGNNEIYVLRWNGSSWEEAGAGSASGGGISNNAGLSESSSLAIGEDDTPYVTWQDNSSGNYEVYIRRWNGSSWEEVGIGSASSGGISNNSGASGDAEVAIALDGIAYVVWQNETVADYEIYVRRWLE
jgi:hypothetical protein